MVGASWGGAARRCIQEMRHVLTCADAGGAVKFFQPMLRKLIIPDDLQSTESETGGHCHILVVGTMVAVCAVAARVNCVEFVSFFNSAARHENKPQLNCIQLIICLTCLTEALDGTADGAAVDVPIAAAVDRAQVVLAPKFRDYLPGAPVLVCNAGGRWSTDACMRRR